MDDLVKRLRDLSDCKHSDLSIGNEAADRIEQLEAALQGLFDNFLELYAKDGCDCDDCEAVRFARAGLGEKKDGN
jgi:hypothetical protein